MKDRTCLILDALKERFSRLPSQCSPQQPMFDAQGREYLVVYRTMPTSIDGKKGAIASNLTNFRVNEEYPQAFQARDLSAIGESSKIRKIAQKLDPTRLLVASGDPTIGSPIVWTDAQGKSYVLGGNGRTIAFLIASDDRYKDYVDEATQRWFNIYDSTPKKGYRNLLVREVYKADGSPLSLKEAVQLAGASQESTAGKETPLRQALSRARGMGITEESNLGQISTPMALSPYTIDKFMNANVQFTQKVLNLVPDYIKAQLSNVDDKTKPIAFDAISSVLVGRYLPVKFVQQGFGNDKEEEAIIGVLPSLVALQQGIEKGRIYPQYDLLNKLETARSFMKMYRWKSYGDALKDYKLQCELQTSFLEPSPVCAMNKLGVAFGLYLKRMVQSSDPTKGVSDINKYIDKAIEDDPNMVGMFGEPTPQEIEDKATKTFISLALPTKLGETLMQQNPTEKIMNKDKIIIEALQKRFDNIASEEGKKIYDEVLQRWQKWHRSNYESLTKTGIKLETGDVLIAQRDIFTDPNSYIAKGSIVEVGEATGRGDTTGDLIDGTRFTWDSNNALQSFEVKPSLKIRNEFKGFRFNDGFRMGEAPYILGRVDQSVWKIKREEKPEKTQREEKPEKTQREEKPEKTQREEKPEKTQRTIKPEKTQRTIKPEKTQRTIKPYRVAPQFVDVIFDHDDDGTIIEYNTELDEDTYKGFVNKLRHRMWKKSSGDSGLRPSPKAKRANAGEPYPQKWFINNWVSGARYLLENGQQVFVYKSIDPDLDDNYLLEEEEDLDNLLLKIQTKEEEEEKQEVRQAELSKEIILSPEFPVCRYMKGRLPKHAYASAPYQARKMKCPEGTFLVEQNTPYKIGDYVHSYLSTKNEGFEQPFYRAIFGLSLLKYEGKKNKDYPLSAPYYIELLKTYYETLGYDVCRTNIKGGRSESGKFMIYLEENEDLSDGGYGSKDLEPLAYIPFPTKSDLLYFTESQVDKWIDLAKTKEKKYFAKVFDYAKNDFSLPVSSILTFQLHDDDTVSYFYSFEVLGVFQVNVINHKEDIRVFRSIGYQNNITEYPNVSVTTDPEAMALVDKALQACKEVSEEYKEKEKALSEKKPKRKASKKKTVTIYNIKDGELTSFEHPASVVGKQFAIIKRGKAGAYSYPYELIYIPTGQLIRQDSYMGGSTAMSYQKLGTAKKVLKSLEEKFVAPKEYPKGYVIWDKDKEFQEALKNVWR